MSDHGHVPAVHLAQGENTGSSPFRIWKGVGGANLISPEVEMPSILAEACRITSFLRCNIYVASKTHFDELLLSEARTTLNSQVLQPLSPKPYFPPLGQLYLHDLVSNLQPSNFSRTSLRHSCYVNALKRGNAGKSLWSLDWAVGAGG